MRENRLFNFVATDSEEGQPIVEGRILHRLLEKLDSMNEALEGRVFDVIGEVLALNDVNLPEILRDAAYDPRRLDEYIDQIDRIDPAKLKEYETATGIALARSHVDFSAFQRRNLEVDEKRLMPRYVEAQFVAAAREVGLRLEPRADGLWRIEHVLADLRSERLHTVRRLGKADSSYRKVTFHKHHLEQDAHPDAALMGSGHPLYAAVDEKLNDQLGTALGGTGFYIDPLSRDAYRLHFFEIVPSDILLNLPPHPNPPADVEAHEQQAGSLFHQASDFLKSTYQLDCRARCQKKRQHFAQVCREYLERSFNARIKRAQERAMLLAAEASTRPEYKLTADEARKQVEDLQRAKAERLDGLKRLEIARTGPVRHLATAVVLTVEQASSLSSGGSQARSLSHKTWGGLAEEVRYWGNWVLERVKTEIGDFYPLIPDPEYKGNREGGAGFQPVQKDLLVTRRNLPHWQIGDSTYFITFRTKGLELSSAARKLVLDACRHFDGQRYVLWSAVVMPDHAHLLLCPKEQTPGQWWSLSSILHSIKSYTANRINKLLERKGTVWQDENFDRIVRDEDESLEKWNYIRNDPVKSGLARVPEEWDAFYECTGKMLVPPGEPPPGYLVPVAYLWTRTVRCKNPSCGATVPLVKQTWLCKRKGRYVALKVVAPKGEKKVRFEVVEAVGPAASRSTQAGLGFDPSIGSKGGNATCPFCGTVADSDYVKAEGCARRMGEQMMAIVCTRPGARGKVYLAADDYPEFIPDDEAIRKRIEELCERTGLTVPSEPIEARMTGGICLPYGLTDFGRLFTPRQMLCLLTLAAAVREVVGQAASLVSSDRQAACPPGSYEEEVRPELEQIVRERVDTLWKMGITGADLKIAAVGAGMRAFTRFARVEYANGEEVPAEKFLAEVEGIVQEFMLERIFGVTRSGVAAVDGPSRFYVLWRYTYKAAEMDAGEAIVFTCGQNVELDGQNGLSTGRRALVEKKKGKYRLYDFTERGDDEKLGLPADDGTPAPLIDALHRILWLIENEPRNLNRFLDEARPDRERLRLVAQALAGTALAGRKDDGAEQLVATTTSEQAALRKLLANWRGLTEQGPLFAQRPS